MFISEFLISLSHQWTNPLLSVLQFASLIDGEESSALIIRSGVPGGQPSYPFLNNLHRRVANRQGLF